MWHWDQGRLAYFQFDALRQIAAYVQAHDFKAAERPALLDATGLEFAAPPTHTPWRNYSRILKLCLLVSDEGEFAPATPLAQLLAQPGLVTCDEYLHFLARAFTEPSPALAGWRPDAGFRYPLLFALKYLLAKTAMRVPPVATYNEIIGAYRRTRLTGEEDETPFIAAARRTRANMAAGNRVGNPRQARESLKVIAQISYLHIRGRQISVSLNHDDADDLFKSLNPIDGHRAVDGDAEIRRLAALFTDGYTDISFDYPKTILDEVVQSGFREGTKAKRTHVTIERNASLRRDYFKSHPTAVCDVCALNTLRTYPWAKRVMDLHHLLPLCSGTRVEEHGTTFDDLVPVCPSCHRATHRFYDRWLAGQHRDDFRDKQEALAVYREMKSRFQGLVCA